MTYDSRQISARDGARLVTYRWPTPDRARAALVIVHGAAEHARRYARFAEALSAHGIAVYGLDLRGHGATARAADHGFFGDSATWDLLVDDIQRVGGQAREDTPAPLFLLGHGVGACLAMSVLQRYGRDYAGAILGAIHTPQGPWCRAAALLARAEIARMDARGASAVLHSALVGANDRRLARRFGAQADNAWLSADDAAIAAYAADPDCGFTLRAGSWHVLLTGMAASQSAHARRRMPVALPLLLLAGSDDPAGNFGRGPERLARALTADGQRDLELRVYEGRRHELLHDHSADTVITDIRSWIVARVPQSADIRSTTEAV